MKKNIIATFGGILLLSSATTTYAFDTVVLKNATSCLVTTNADGSIKKEKVRSISIFSFYYTSQDSSSRTYYSTIPENGAGVAAVGDFSPGITPPQSNTSLSFSPSAGYTTGSTSYIAYGKTINNWYVYQYRDQTVLSYCAHGPCITLSEKNPCETA